MENNYKVKVVTQVKRLGTVKLLELTNGMNDEKSYELVKYISYLEASENRLAQQIQNFYDAVSHYKSPTE